MNDYFALVWEFFIFIDNSLLLTFNGLSNPVMDAVMPVVSMRTVWIPLYLLLFCLAWRRYGWKGAVLCLLTVLLAVAAADQLCGSFLRGLIGRLRPSNPDNPVSRWVNIVNDYRGGKYGFPSCHAANTAAVAMLLSLWLKRRGMTAFLFSWAGLVSLSRIYLGVHYPGDVLLGFSIGAGIAYALWRLMLYDLRHARRTSSRLGLHILPQLQNSGV